MNQHSMAPSASTNTYKSSSFPQIIWDLTDSLISPAEISDQNQNSLLVKRQNDNITPGALTEDDLDII